ncbi:RagB/SusD family nutrient uptake outer membrane protein [Pedobacter sp. BMA]|uniref:RagB/SusD family nutrient uptake outer membrane protein n=1 Tax=Pedobacter sp. BMA TaxID=1663685 RepID=UPI000649EDE6|nr:RagB/SusD family nutrient uptake outer membrane protein [Pedobacter sp. BMA]KLT64135.1 starch-binding protein [Pedobacter sp. BMA]
MNFYKVKIHIRLAALVATILLFGACKKALDKEPMSNITPEKYLQEEGQLAAYAVARYPDILPSHGNWSFGTFGTDGNTDNMVIPALDNKFIPGLWRVEATGGDWSFTNIYQTNYFLNTVLPRWKAGQIVGNADNIKQYIGEIYFLRAYEYFKKLQTLGDFPIVRGVYPDEKEILTQISKRQPCNEVARFIISDLDSAALLLKASPVSSKNRISKECAQLLKSRVALFEGTWLKYFKGTAFVPNGQNWPGKAKDYNASYQFPSGTIESEIDYFLTQAMASAKVVADAIALVSNTGTIESPNNENPYFNMFSATNMSGYSEVLLWRQYAAGLVTHNVPVYAQAGNYAVGLSRSMVESFLMDNGLPIYATGSNYQGDDYIADVRKNRDGRLTLFLKEPGQKNVLLNAGQGTHATAIEPTPRIYEPGYEQKYTTGYTIRKGLSYDAAQANNGQGYTGSITFRASEAYLNYIEASYEKNGLIDADATRYWQQLRARAKVNIDFQQTISATVMSRETQDWGAYSANALVSPTLYNIRRERRSELMAEGLRFMDLKRWRAMDQMITTPYHFEGFKLWGPMRSWYTAAQIIYGATDTKAIVSDPALSLYLRPQEIRSNADSYKGARWTMAHYLSPIATQHFNITSTGGNFATSPIYQNPGWSTAGGSIPTGL